MEEKIKIYVSSATARQLQQDVEQFEYVKKNGTANRNGFLSALILYYHEKYDQLLKKREQRMREILAAHGLKTDKIASLALQLANQDMFQEDTGEKRKHDVAISLKVTKATKPILEYIMTYSLQEVSLSSYLRQMLESYCSLPQDERERIIFHPIVNLWEQGVAEKRKLMVLHKNGKTYTVCPYALATGKEELFNYCLAVRGTMTASFRLCKLASIRILSEVATINEKLATRLEYMKSYAPQFAKNENVESAVELTEDGKFFFEKMYVHRPHVERIEGNIYYFKASLFQMRLYFLRLGGMAKVLYPESLRKDMLKMYRKGLAIYGDKKRS